jgi:molybdopterin-biosynthesis enzyme MoeA-like protein
MTTLSDRSISTAGALIIGDEVLSSKTMDTNSAHFGNFPRVTIDE